MCGFFLLFVGLVSVCFCVSVVVSVCWFCVCLACACMLFTVCIYVAKRAHQMTIRLTAVSLSAENFFSSGRSLNLRVF